MARCGTSLVVQKAGTRRFLIEHPRSTYDNGSFLKVPMMGGITREEGTSFVAGKILKIQIFLFFKNKK